MAPTHSPTSYLEARLRKALLAVLLILAAATSYGQGPVIRFNSYPATPFTCDQSAITGGVAPSYFDTTLNSLQVCTAGGWVTVPGTSPSFSGQTAFAGGSVTAPGLVFSIAGVPALATGLYSLDPSSLYVAANSVGIMRFASGAITMLGTHALGWAPGIGSSQDLSLYRDGAADIFAQRRTTNAQTFRVYKTWTDASNGSWVDVADLKTTADVAYMGPRANGSGSRTLPVSIGTGRKALTAAAATNIVQISIASGVQGAGGFIDYSVHANDTVDYQTRTGRVGFQIVNKGGTETCVVAGPAGNANPTEAQDGSSIAQSSASTLTYTWGVDTTPSNACNLTLNAASGLVETTLVLDYRVTITSLTTPTVTPQ